MNTRQAYKILKPVIGGGRTAKLSHYWWVRVTHAIVWNDWHDHRVMEAIKVTRTNIEHYGDKRETAQSSD